jgi:hypothetical protein
MATSIVIHVGPRKTGTTYLQKALTLAAPTLRESGVLYVTRLAGVDRYNHVAATYAVSGLRSGRSSHIWRNVSAENIHDLVRQLDAWDGPAIISSEALGGLNTAEATEFISYLPSAPVHVIATLRALPDVVLSSWSQNVVNLHTQSLDTYVKRSIKRRTQLPPSERWRLWDEDPHATFWRSYDYPGLLSRWTQMGFPVSAVVVPDSAQPLGELWTRFREAVNLDALPPIAPVVGDAEANVARSFEELEIIRNTVKSAAQQGLTLDDLRQLRGKRWQVPQGTYLHSGTRPGLVPATAEVFEQWAREDAGLLTKLPINLVGQIEDLLRPARRPETPQPAASAEVAGRLVASRIFPIVRDQYRRAERGSWARRLKSRLNQREVRLGRWRT